MATVVRLGCSPRICSIFPQRTVNSFCNSVQLCTIHIFGRIFVLSQYRSSLTVKIPPYNELCDEIHCPLLASPDNLFRDLLMKLIERALGFWGMHTPLNGAI
ncbi:hypothetical protein H113_06546 [Trichophyton rubrum MR1459]|uniref:Uncharacterized protein n=1 Tax=Trichophyton rubrum (strain ATCC MYA-4607 / CBS 118892) TaxID=559305 RepID=A0A080WJB5_TRIRC|nr:uncharacterized protein TERG_11771 [Trichophyton rubrum CBS 118892]EZF92600.1 hypothetical protein H113_06546 [Trichophyton rubrum MR1459]EZG03679.1 hypothetical protein H106_06343 [Trichophyton rubrum CBS 735.88]KFL60712.1 hypothetical protein TERG_11771 [Trichophyton rubrum CBS 118892]